MGNQCKSNCMYPWISQSNVFSLPLLAAVPMFCPEDQQTGTVIKDKMGFAVGEKSSGKSLLKNAIFRTVWLNTYQCASA